MPTRPTRGRTVELDDAVAALARAGYLVITESGDADWRDQWSDGRVQLDGMYAPYDPDVMPEWIPERRP